MYGPFNEASEEDCERVDSFCSLNAVEPSTYYAPAILSVSLEGSNVWGLDFHLMDPSYTQRHIFQGTIDNQSKLYGTGIKSKRPGNPKITV